MSRAPRQKSKETGIENASLFFASLPEDLAEALQARAVTRTYDRGQIVFLQGDPAESVFIVLEGWVKLFRNTRHGSEAVVGVFTRGQSFGETLVFHDDVFPFGAEAVTPCRLMQVSAGTISDLMTSRPEVCTAIITTIFKHLHTLVEQIEQLTTQTGQQRVATFLLELCAVSSGSCTVTLPYDKVLIAGRLGMKPESLSRAFHRLQDVGVQIKQNHAAIADVARLQAYVSKD
ncbi:Crp/Fnr family transcriptional regulator [Denitrobaculum tricleocarpae]|uniref:Crp/Fnr family transcriptional regulator n=1 Tax=Denitrobaculum tricleocarpae TaxID=2591009 RepID=A0A545SZ81_9PROT|nr:Crp/Fnr family transcriptional regulator [Denitrobaculum tricleocarpae]TQV70274.1 Crp/Fnr family transcriptional regulator [Denitrobaculum tricleocarpae]